MAEFDLVALHEDFKKENEPYKERLLSYFQSRYGMSVQDLEEIFKIAEEEISMFFDVAKMKCSRKDAVTMNSLVTIFLSGFFFAAFLMKNKHFRWPDTEKEKR